MKHPLILIAALAAALSQTSCKPATSDIMVELVDTAYVAQLPSKADTTIMLEPAGDEKVLGAAKGYRFIIGGGQKDLTLWYDGLGKVLSMQERMNGVLVDSVMFYPNGQRIFKLTFNDKGIADGPAHFFYSDGRIREDGRFVAGIKTGIWRQFSAEGKLEQTHEFDKYGQKKR